ncbi:MAG TPA: DUF6174 domain-containing protein [Anaerolineales bacterium]|nr:DUF6174 domain-containing protein [Anaerolineales bacterium]
MKKLLLITLALVLAACSAAPSEPETPPTGSPAAERQTWEDANISQYRFELTLSCFCAFRDHMPLTIEVRDGKVVSITRADGQAVTPEDPNYEFYLTYGTIDDLFTRIESAKADPEAGEVTVTYDPTLGYPADASIDYILLAADDEMYFTVSGFETLP